MVDNKAVGMATTLSAGTVDNLQATYIQTDLYQQDSCLLCDLGSKLLSIDSAKQSSLE